MKDGLSIMRDNKNEEKESSGFGRLFADLSLFIFIGLFVLEILHPFFDELVAMSVRSIPAFLGWLSGNLLIASAASLVLTCIITLLTPS